MSGSLILEAHNAPDLADAIKDWLEDGIVIEHIQYQVAVYGDDADTDSYSVLIIYHYPDDQPA